MYKETVKLGLGPKEGEKKVLEALLAVGVTDFFKTPQLYQLHIHGVMTRVIGHDRKAEWINTAAF